MAPVRISKLKSGRYKVSTSSGIKAKSTTKAKAQSQARLLRAVDKGFKPKKR